MKHDTSSPAEEATEWVTGAGRGVRPSVDFVPSYVVKNAPAWRDQCLLSTGLEGKINKKVLWLI